MLTMQKTVAQQIGKRVSILAGKYILNTISVDYMIYQAYINYLLLLSFYIKKISSPPISLGPYTCTFANSTRTRLNMSQP